MPVCGHPGWSNASDRFGRSKEPLCCGHIAGDVGFIDVPRVADPTATTAAAAITHSAVYSSTGDSMPTGPTINPPERTGRSYIKRRTKQMANAEENIQRATAIATRRLM